MISDVLNPDGRPDWDKMTDDEIVTKVYCIIVIHKFSIEVVIFYLLLP